MGRRATFKHDPTIVLAYKQEQARKDIETITAWLRDPRIELYQRTIKTGKLMQSYKIIGDTDKMLQTARQLIAMVKEQNYKIPEINQVHATAIWNHFHVAYITLAPYSFIHFLHCMEWNTAVDKQFFSSRANVIGEDAHWLELLEFGKLKGLAISAPPRTYKTGLGEHFLCWVLGRHPDKSTMFVTHTLKMARKVYADILRMMAKPEYHEVFPEIKIAAQSAEDLWIDLEPKQEENTYKTFYLTGIDGNMAGVMEASWLLYCDDLIVNELEARNPDRLDNAWTKYTADIRQRRKDDNVRELHIATRWGMKDVVNQLEQIKKGDKEWRFIKRPALGPQGNSNFMFNFHPLTKEHFQEIKLTMDPITFECIYQQNPMDRQGILFPEAELKTFLELPKQEPDEIFAACDVAFSGSDFLSLPIAFQYGDVIYIPAVIFDPHGYNITEPEVSAFILKHKPQRVYFEAQNGGEFYANDIRNALKGKSHTRVESKKTTTKIGKIARIEQFEPDIKEFRFLDRGMYKPDSQYAEFIRNLTSFNRNGSNKHDDAPDSLAMLASMKRLELTGKVETFPRSWLF